MTFFQKKWQCVTMWNMNFRCFLQWMNVCHLICLLIIVWCSVQPRWRQYKTQNPGFACKPTPWTMSAETEHYSWEGIPFLVRVLDSRVIMVKLFLLVPYPFQTAAPFQDNFGETPSIIFHRPRLGLKLVHSSHHPHSNHFTHSYSSPHHSFWWWRSLFKLLLSYNSC